MRLQEHEAKDIFRRFGIPIPEGIVVKDTKGAEAAVKMIGPPVAIKAQVLAGERGRHRGIVFADTLQEAVEESQNLLKRRIRGSLTREILIEKRIDAKYEYYLGVTIDQQAGTPTVIFSTEGGIEVETTAKETPEKMVSCQVRPSRGLLQFDARNLCLQLNLRDRVMLRVSAILHSLYGAFRTYDATTAEINPLLVARNGEVYAVDAVLDIDDNSLYRHTDIPLKLEERIEDEIEREAVRNNLSYVRLDGNIGVIGSGAGLTMATIDLIETFGGKAANFLETGGGITEGLMENAVKIVLKDERLKALFVNLYGGINPMVAAAKGIVKACREVRPSIRILVKVIGNMQEEAWKILENAGIPAAKDIESETAVRKLMDLMGGEDICAS